ncbi:hypothetical protein RFI_22265, partial [Reticulomyxa filosa]
CQKREFKNISIWNNLLKKFVIFSLKRNYKKNLSMSEPNQEKEYDDKLDKDLNADLEATEIGAGAGTSKLPKQKLKKWSELKDQSDANMTKALEEAKQTNEKIERVAKNTDQMMAQIHSFLCLIISNLLINRLEDPFKRSERAKKRKEERLQKRAKQHTERLRSSIIHWAKRYLHIIETFEKENEQMKHPSHINDQLHEISQRLEYLGANISKLIPEQKVIIIETQEEIDLNEITIEMHHLIEDEHDEDNEYYNELEDLEHESANENTNDNISENINENINENTNDNIKTNENVSVSSSTDKKTEQDICSYPSLYLRSKSDITHDSNYSSSYPSVATSNLYMYTYIYMYTMYAYIITNGNCFELGVTNRSNQ